MRELNVCLKLNFLCRKIPILIGIILISILFIESKKDNVYISMDSIHVLESLFLIIYGAYNYKNSFVHWISIGGRRKDFYLSSFILYVFTAAVVSYAQTLIFIGYVPKIQILLGEYGKLSLFQVASFTPLEFWIYLFFSFMCSICAGSLLGVLNIRYSLSESLAMSFGYYFGLTLVYMFLIKIFQDSVPDFIINQATIYLFEVTIYAVSIYIGWRVISWEVDLCTD